MTITYLFIDGGYLRRNYADSVRRWFGSDGEIDFEKIKSTYHAERCFYYDALEDERRQNETTADFDLRVQQEESFFTRIEEVEGTFVRLGSVTGKARNKRQKKVDILVAIEMLDHAVRRNMNRAVLLTGDRDFEPLVQSLVQTGVRVQIVGDKTTTSRYLARAADIYIPLRFEDYHRWTTEKLRTGFPISIRQTNMPPHESKVIERAQLSGKEFTLQRLDSTGLYYIYGHEFYRATNHLTLESNDLPRLKLYFELQYGKPDWVPFLLK